MKRKLIRFLLPLCLLFASLGFAACKNSPDTLSAPQNLRVENGVLYWDEVEDADGYTVCIDNQEYDSKECSFHIAGFSETEIYSVEIQAYTNGGVCSRYAALTYTGKYALPTEGVEYKLLKTGQELTHCRVEKFAVDGNGVCVIPATYEGLPVTDFSTSDTAQEVFAKIKSLYLPGSIERQMLTGAKFSKFQNLENIVLGEGNEKYISEGNCIVNKERDTLVVGCINSIIPDYVTTIGDRAYCGRNVTSFTVPAQITKISGFAFMDCTSLKSVKIPDGVQIMDSMFVGCTSLTDVNIPEGVKSLLKAFSGCTSLVNITIPESVNNLKNTFEDCTSLKDVNIPASVIKLEGTFWNCTALESITIPENVKTLKGTFYGCASLTNVVLNEGLEVLEYDSLPRVGSRSVFQNCVSLSKLSLPSTLKRIGMYSFSGCVSLKSLEIPDSVTKIDPYAFQNCTSLESIHLSTNLTDFLGHTAFNGCASLKSIIIPDGITELRNNIFKNCTSLQSIVLPKGIKTDYPLFEDCPLEEVYYRGTEEEWEENVSKIDKNNAELFSATRYYYSETAPTEEGNYWRFVEGVPAKWE